MNGDEKANADKGYDHIREPSNLHLHSFQYMNEIKSHSLRKYNLSLSPPFSPWRMKASRVSFTTISFLSFACEEIRK